MDRIAYKGWESCYYLSNGLVELVVTGDVGPRILRFAFVDGENVFCELEEYAGMTGGDGWRNYGGHRLWHAPESQPRTYAPDNDRVEVEEYEDFVRFVQPVEASTGIEKAMDIRLAPDRAQVRVVHRLRNTTLWPVELAPWALSVMAPGGVGILPLPPRGSHDDTLLPTGSLVLWAYTDMADPRWTWGTQFVLLRQDPAAVSSQKVGASVVDGWVAYAWKEHLFVKTFEYEAGARYPDRGCSAELYTDARILEVETLGPLTRLAPGATVQYAETWSLFSGVPVPADDRDVFETVLPHVR